MKNNMAQHLSREAYHSSIEDKVAQMLELRGYSLKRNKEYKVHIGNGEYSAGECDIIAFKENKPNYALVFEVKARKKSKARRKARKQLKKDNQYIAQAFGKNIRCFNFFAFSSYAYEMGKIEKAFTLERIPDMDL